MPPANHAFEDCGLGKALFQFVRVIRHRTVEGVCAYCGQRLRNECVVQSADGKEFTVGSDCVRKPGDFGLHGTTEAEIKRLLAEEQAAAIAHAHALRGRPEVDTALKARPHPFPYLAKEGKTLSD